MLPTSALSKPILAPCGALRKREYSTPFAKSVRLRDTAGGPVTHGPDRTPSRRSRHPRHPLSATQHIAGTTAVNREPNEATKTQVKQRDNFTCLCCGETNKRKLQVDHINPYYLGGASDDLANLQTLCSTCNRYKDTNAWNYRIQRSSHSTLQPLAMPALPEDPRSNEEWERFIRRAINAAYGCAAVADVRIFQRGPRSCNWEVSLFDGNDAAAFDALLPTLLGQIQSIRKRAGLNGPDSLKVMDLHSE